MGHRRGRVLADLSGRRREALALRAAAAFALADLLGQRTVRCERRGTDRYGRVVAVCRVDGVEVNRWLVEQGWALAYVQYGGSVYLEAQRQAQAARRGVWQGSFQAPWEYRKNPGR